MRATISRRGLRPANQRSPRRTGPPRYAIWRDSKSSEPRGLAESQLDLICLDIVELTRPNLARFVGSLKNGQSGLYAIEAQA